MADYVTESHGRVSDPIPVIPSWVDRRLPLAALAYFMALVAIGLFAEAGWAADQREQIADALGDRAPGFASWRSLPLLPVTVWAWNLRLPGWALAGVFAFPVLWPGPFVIASGASRWWRGWLLPALGDSARVGDNEPLDLTDPRVQD